MSYSIAYNFKAIDQYTKVANKITRSTDKMKRSVSSLNNKVKKTALVNKKASASFISLGGVMKGVILGTIGYKVFNTLNTFETSMNRVNAITGATTEQYEKLRNQAKELGKTTQFTAEQAAGAQAFLAQAGFDVNKIYDSMPATLNLAAAAQMDLAQSADIVSNVMAGFGFDAKGIGRAVDVLTKAFVSSNTDLSQLGQAMKYAGPVAKAFKLSFEEATATIGMFGNAGIQASMAGTSLRNILTRLATPSGQARKVMKKLGLQIDKNKISIIDTIVQLKKSSASAADVMTIFGQRAGPAMQSLLTQGTDSLVKLRAALENADGTAQNIANTMMKGLPGAIKLVTSSVENLIIKLGEAGLTDILINIAGAIRFWTIVLDEAIKITSKFGSVISRVFSGTQSVMGVSQEEIDRQYQMMQSMLTPHVFKREEEKYSKMVNPLISKSFKQQLEGSIELSIKDKGKNIDSIKSTAKRGLNLGISGIGIPRGVY